MLITTFCLARRSKHSSASMTAASAGCGQRRPRWRHCASAMGATTRSSPRSFVRCSPSTPTPESLRSRRYATLSYRARTSLARRTSLQLPIALGRQGSDSCRSTGHSTMWSRLGHEKRAGLSLAGLMVQSSKTRTRFLGLQPPPAFVSSATWIASASRRSVPASMASRAGGAAVGAAAARTTRMARTSRPALTGWLYPRMTT